MDKAIEVKRRAQRCILNGDLDGALHEYEKLVSAPDPDPYHFVLLADLLYKKGDHLAAAEGYFNAVDGYERVSLFKNAIAVCKKMSRLTLAPVRVLQKLAELHKLDGLPTEASLYSMQHAELLVRSESFDEAVAALRFGFEACPENLKTLERVAEVLLLADRNDEAIATLLDVAERYNRAGQFADGVRCQDRAQTIAPGAGSAESVGGERHAPAADEPEGERPDGPYGFDGIDPNDQTEVISGSPALDTVEPSSDEDAPLAEHDAGEVGTTPAPPSLVFEPTAEEEQELKLERLKSSMPVLPDTEPATEPELKKSPRSGETAEESQDISRIGKLLDDAQGFYTSGDREAAGETLLNAACAYDRIGHHDSAAAIYRGLRDARQTTPQVLQQWLENCERRGDVREGSRVACMLGSFAKEDGDTDGARDWFTRARDMDASNAFAMRELEELAQREASGGVATVADASRDETGVEVGEPGAAAEASLQASPEAEDEDSDAVLDDGAPPDLGWLISEFQRGVAEQLANDGRAHYDLGVSYREMGLHEQAIASFREAARDPEHVAVAAEMLVRSLLDSGCVEEAVAEVRALLETRNLDADSTASLNYQLGVSLETSGRQREALEAFELAAAQAPDFADVRVRIEDLSQKLERS